MTTRSVVPHAPARPRPAHARRAALSRAFGIITAICGIASACQGPSVAGPHATPLAVNRTVAPDTGDYFYVRGGTFNSSGGFIQSSGVDSLCGVDQFFIDTPHGDLGSVLIQECGPSGLNAPGGAILDGGQIEVFGAFPPDTTEVIPIQADWHVQAQIFVPTGMTAVLQSDPFPGFHFVEWKIETSSGALIGFSTSPRISRTRGSSSRVFQAWFEQNTTTGGGGGGGGGSGSGGGTGGDTTCLSCGGHIG